jgi:hypothetical protein
MDSQRTKYWTVEKAEGAIRAAFFARGLVPLASAEDVWLRFMELKQIIASAEAPIGDRTLSRALASLVKKRGLTRKREGKASLYNLVIQRADRVKAFARAEGAAIEGAAQLGGYGDSTEGWSVFGIPEILPMRYRRTFKKECVRHQLALREILDEVFEDAADAILRPARRRVSRAKLTAGERALAELFELEVMGSMVLGYGVRFWGVVESTVPGAPRAVQRGMGLNFSPEVGLLDRLAVFLSKVTERPIDEIRPEMDKEAGRLERKIGRATASFRLLWDALTPRERERAQRRLQSATSMTACLTSVVHA